MYYSSLFVRSQPFLTEQRTSQVSFQPKKEGTLFLAKRSVKCVLTLPVLYCHKSTLGKGLQPTFKF